MIKDNLAVEAEDCISRKDTIDYFNDFREKIKSMPLMDVVDRLKELPSVYPKKEDYLKANEQLKKQLEMLKLDRDCDKSVLEDIKAELQKKKLLDVHPHETAKNVYRVAMNDAIECINKHISRKE